MESFPSKGLEVIRPAPKAFETPRGVRPAILLEQVRNTAPYLFEHSFGNSSGGLLPPQFRFQAVLRRTAMVVKLGSEPELSHADYFELCLSAHFATVATFVPTDVDNQIRFRLWHPLLPVETVRAMAEAVEAMAEWDSRAVSTRWLAREQDNRVLSGHDGEWFSTAVAAYAALLKKDARAAAGMADRIAEEVAFEAEFLSEAWKREDGISLLKAATLVAHNLGDLDRVMEMWKLPDCDPLKRGFYRLGHEGPRRFGGWLLAAGALNKALTADENPRHFALRGPRCLRRAAELSLPVGPFFDEWGAQVARHPLLSPEEVAEVAEALVDGWEWLAKKAEEGATRPPVGYARALAGIVARFPGGMSALARHLPARIARALKAGALHGALAIDRARFEEQWNRMALNHLRKYFANAKAKA